MVIGIGRLLVVYAVRLPQRYVVLVHNQRGSSVLGVHEVVVTTTTITAVATVEVVVARRIIIVIFIIIIILTIGGHQGSSSAVYANDTSCEAGNLVGSLNVAFLERKLGGSRHGSSVNDPANCNTG